MLTILPPGLCRADRSFRVSLTWSVVTPRSDIKMHRRKTNIRAIKRCCRLRDGLSAARLNNSIVVDHPSCKKKNHIYSVRVLAINQFSSSYDKLQVAFGGQTFTRQICVLAQTKMIGLDPSMAGKLSSGVTQSRVFYQKHLTHVRVINSIRRVCLRLPLINTHFRM